MSKLISKIQESAESKIERNNERFQAGIIKSLQFPKTDSEGYTVGIFTDFQVVEPTGEVRQSRTGNTWTDDRIQLKFTFQVDTEDGEKLNLNFWTGTCIDGIKNEKGEYSKLVTWLIAIEALDASQLHTKFKAEASSIMKVIKDCFEEPFRFKTEMDGRIHKPILTTFKLIESPESPESPEENPE